MKTAKKLAGQGLKESASTSSGTARPTIKKRQRRSRTAPEQASARSGEIPVFPSRRREILKGQQKKEPKGFIKPESFSFERGCAADLIKHAKQMHEWKMKMRGAQPGSKSKYPQTKFYFCHFRISNCQPSSGRWIEGRNIEGFQHR